MTGRPFFAWTVQPCTIKDGSLVDIPGRLPFLFWLKGVLLQFLFYNGWHEKLREMEPLQWSKVTLRRQGSYRPEGK